MKKYLIFPFALLLVLALAGCNQEVTAVTETTAPTVTMAAAIPETTAETEPPAGQLLSRRVNDKVCIAIIPEGTGTTQYAILPDQEAAVAAFQQAVSTADPDEWYIKGDEATGLSVYYMGEAWEFLGSGELVCWNGRVKAEDAAELYSLCAAAAESLGWGEAVRPEQLKGIRSATLSVDSKTVTLTDPQALLELENMLSGAKKQLGGTSCPFGARLTMELETGETVSLTLATDSCGTWISQGVYFDFGSDSQPLYDLFGVTLSFGLGE